MKQVPIQPVPLHRLFVNQKTQSIEIGRDFLTVINKQDSVRVDLSSATLSSSPSWLLLKKITLTTPQGSFQLAGIPKAAIGDVKAAIQEAHRRKSASETLLGQADQVQALLGSWDALTSRDAYLTATEALQRQFPTLGIRALTAHGSKGLEADYVAIVGLSSGKYGFPSEIADDPVLGLVLADGEAFEHAEERRLLYVALTRARKRVYLVADAASPSAFVREVLADDGYEKTVVGAAPATSDVCPECARGKVTKREGDFGVFYSCSNHPICTYKGAVCSRCGRGRMRGGDGTEAVCESCGFKSRPCPRCRLGMLVEKRNRKNGNPFWGCSNYGRKSEPCEYTEPIIGRGGG